MPGAIAATALTVIVTWGVTKALNSVETAATSRHPVSWVVESNPAKVGGFSDLPIELVLPTGRHPATSPGPGCSNFADWARRQGGTDAGTTRLAIVVRGRADGQVLISNARAVVVSRRAPPKGLQILCPSAGEAELRPLRINLDSIDRQAHYESASGRRFGFTVEKGETETFLLSATTHRATYRWYLELTIVTGGGSQVLRVDDHGRPFETTPKQRHGVVSWNGDDAWAGPDHTLVRVGTPLGLSGSQ